jgi:hypothetical protein
MLSILEFASSEGCPMIPEVVARAEGGRFELNQYLLRN